MFTRHTYQFEQVELHTIEFGEFECEAYLHLLNEAELEKVNKFILPKRKREFIATRMVKNELFPQGQILYTAHGAPYFAEGPHLSISHSPGVAGIAFCPDFPLGFDLEPIREKVHRIKDKFLHSTEKQLPYITDTEALITIWSAKEALFKLAGQDGLIFSEDLYIEFTGKHQLIGNYRIDGQWRAVHMRTFRQGETLLTTTGTHV
jgi:4'-phosphopantetheinyl transferase